VLPALIVALVVASIAACGDAPQASSAPQASTGVSSAPQASTAASTRHATTRCKPSQVSIRGAASYATQSAFMGFVLRNRGARACVVRGHPAVGIIGSSGRRLHVRRFVQDPGERPRRVLLRARGRSAASFRAQWFDYCGPQDDPLSPRVALPGTRTWIVVKVIGQPLFSPVCNDRGHPSHIGINQLLRGNTPGAPS
jgi:hypothetical protein